MRVEMQQMPAGSVCYVQGEVEEKQCVAIDALIKEQVPDHLINVAYLALQHIQAVSFAQGDCCC